MTSDERQALVERLARAVAWGALEDHERARLSRKAEQLVSELEADNRQAPALWALHLDPSAEPDPD